MSKLTNLQRIKRVVNNIDINNPHDALFKYTMGTKEAIKDFLTLNLPEVAQNNLNLNTLNRKNETYSDIIYKKGIMDVIYEVDFKENNSGYLICLFEHKSSSENDTILQVLDYLVKIWFNKFDDNTIPPVLPIVIYHGDENWTAVKELINLFQADIEWMKDFIPNFKLHFYDFIDLFSQLKDIKAPEYEIYVRTLDIVKTKDKDEALEKFNKLLLSIKQNNWQSEWRESVITCIVVVYLSLVAKSLKDNNLVQKTQRILPERSEILVPVNNVLIKKGKEKGREEGRKEGRKEGQLELLTRQLTKKLSQYDSEKIKSILKDADNTALKKLSEKIFDIKDLSEVKKIIEE